ncbi:MAG: TonB-dependent receptor [Bryobacteraceae bacterium]
MKKLWVILCAAIGLSGQTTTSLVVRISAPDGAPVRNAQVNVFHSPTGFDRALAPIGDDYVARDLPLQNYRLRAGAPGFQTEQRDLVLRSNVPMTLDLELKLESVRDQITVSANAASELIDIEATGTSTALSANAMETMPAPLGSRGLETYLLSFPGFAMNANGAIHPRGAHNQMTFVIDGMPISDQLTGAFATALDPNLVDNLTLHTGNIPAEFGSKVSGVAAISTKSAAGSGRRFFGNAQINAGRFDTLEGVAQAGGEKGRFAFFTSVAAVKTHRFLDQVSLDNLHNGGNAERGFLRLDYQPSSRDTVHFNVMSGRSRFELANLRSQQAVGMDQSQVLRDVSLWLRWNRILSPSSTWESTLAYRPTVAQLFGSPTDTPVTASQARHLSTVTFANRFNKILGPHTIRSGADIQHFPISENFTMGITDPLFNAPGSIGFNDGLLPYDLTRGGRIFVFSDRNAGMLVSGFVQDSVTLGRFVLSVGARYDRYRLVVKGNQLQPRLGVSFHLKETGTVLRASYNRNYQTPPNENLLLSSSPAAARLAPASVREALGNAFAPLLPQRENVYEVGLQQALMGRASLNASFYHKNSIDQQDNNNFFNTGVIFPVTLARIRVNGAEARLTLPTFHRLNGTLSATHARAISTPPFTGGLFLGQDAIALLSSGPFVIDHDQKLSLQGTAHYTINKNWWASTSIRYDSGLVANPSNPVQVAADPDFADLLPYVKLNQWPARVRPRTITDVAFGYQHNRRGSTDAPAWDVQVQVNNLFDVTALYNFQSVFVGTRLVAPRAVGVKMRWYW